MTYKILFKCNNNFFLVIVNILGILILRLICLCQFYDIKSIIAISSVVHIRLI